MVKLPSGKEMLVLSLVGWTTALALVLAAVRFGGPMRLVAVVWCLGVLIWTIVGVLRLGGTRE